MSDDEFASRPTLLTSDVAGDAPPDSADAPARPASALIPGALLFGAYEIEDVLGTGGMGAVYRARHRSLGGRRAIKVMHPALMARPEAVERFHREARALLEVNHPAVVRCHDLLRDEAGSFFLVMEMVEGVSLDARLKEGPLGDSEVRALGVRLAGGLAAAHACGVIHRDLSPDNIVLPDGRPERAKIIDFGIAKVLVAGEETVAEGFKGKIGFASPEQLGFHGGSVDRRSDYYSLGLLLVAAATGRALDMGANFADAVESRRTLPALPARVGPALREEIEPLLAFDPDERPDLITTLFGGEDTHETPPAALAASPRPGREGPAPTPPQARRTALVAGLLALVAIAGAGLWLGRGDDLGNTTPDSLRPSAPAAVSAALPASEARFRELRSALATLGAGAGQAALGVEPSPVPHESAYRLRIEASCDCYPLVFLIDGEDEELQLLYPNAADPQLRMETGAPFQVPTLLGGYDLIAERGAGIDRLKVLLLPEPPSFPPTGAPTSWSARPGEEARLDELAALLAEGLPAGWRSAEAALEIAP